jgi:hypothetical protein
MSNVRRIRRLLIAATVTGFLSLFLPWWNLILFANGVGATFFLFLWGTAKSGFVRAEISFEWWSYTTLATIAIAVILSFLTFWFLAKKKGAARDLIALQSVVSAAGCLFYLFSLYFTFGSMFRRHEDFWLTVSFENTGPLAFGALHVLDLHFYDLSKIIVLQSVGLGILLALSMLCLSLRSLRLLSRSR